MFMAYDQYGNQHASKMYVDRKDGTYHIGYIIAGLWIEIFGLEGITFARKVTLHSRRTNAVIALPVNKRDAALEQRIRHESQRDT
jgi:hypothetical protein